MQSEGTMNTKQGMYISARLNLYMTPFLLTRGPKILIDDYKGRSKAC